MRLTISDRKSLTKAFVERYRHASKIEKAIVLNELIDLTGFNRHYAARVLRFAISGKKKVPRTRTPHVRYDQNVKSVLAKLWEITDFICGKRLVAIIPELIQKCEQFHELEIPDTIHEKMKKISAATIDRILKPNRKSLGRKGTSMTKGIRYLIDRIPVKTFGEWKDSPAGFTQMDLVLHNGGNVFGGFLYTLNTTDIHTKWTVCTLLQDKTAPEMLKDLDSMFISYPFPLHGIHSDNGSEFINDSVLASGNSGNFMSPHYGDQVKMYLAGDYRKVNFTAAEIERDKESVLTLVPGR